MANTDEILIEVRPGRIRTALLAAGRLVELIVEDEKSQSLVGNIYLGRVEKVIGSLNAAFVDLGLERSGFLALAEARPPAAQASAKDTISKYLCEGDRVAVQVLRDPFEDKGPKLTTRLALTARTVILTPGDAAVRLSKRIEDKEVRSRLECQLKDEAGLEEGFIARSAAVSAPGEEIAIDIALLRDAALKIEQGRADASAPSLLLEDADGALRTLRDFLLPDVERVVIDDTTTYLAAKSYLQSRAPGLLERLIHHKGEKPLFADEDLGEDLENALAGQVLLPSGGTVIFSETPALVAIDVNVAGTSSGGREQSALKTNLEAAQEIARQIRLRNLSGLLVVDFVSMKNRDNGAKLLDALKREVSDDAVQVFIGGFTRFGLVEMTRKRTRPSLASSLGTACGTCVGNGITLSPETIAYQALDQLGVEAAANPSNTLELRVSERVAAALNGPVKEAQVAFEQRLGRTVTITIDAKRNDESFDVACDARKKG